MKEQYTLYGSYASYYTAKTRAYLRKKGIPFVERLPSDPQFREKVRPASGSHRIPQLLAPDGTVVQDSVAIQDYLEAKFSYVPAFPATPNQTIYVRLMELLASEGLLKLAWLHRWIFEDDNLHFVKMDFGRSFKPQGSDDELLKYGNLIADRMMSNGGLPPSTPALRAELDSQLLSILVLIETHLIDHPYMLGGHPCAADYAMMGALHAHMGRDPAGLHFMQQNAPRVFRWVEHMMTPEIQSPEFFDRAVAYLENDEVPATAMAILHHIAESYGEQFILSALAFNQLVKRTKPKQGYRFSEENDQPVLDSEAVEYKGQSQQVKVNLHGVWLLQRSQIYFQSLSLGEQQKVKTLFGEGLAWELVSTPVTARLERLNNRLVVA